MRLTGYTGYRYEAYDPIDTKNDFSETNLQKLIDKLAHYEDLEESGRLVVLPEGDGRTLLISALAHSEICPHNCGLKEYCHIAGCKDCWEAALEGENNGD